MNGTAAKQENRGIIFASAFIIIFCCGGISAFSVFARALQQSTGGTASQVAMAYSLNLFFLAFVGIFSGRIVDRHDPKILMFSGGILMGLGWILSAFVKNPYLLWLVFGVVMGSGEGLCYNPCINLALRWYPEKRGTMSGALLCAAALGPFTLAKVGAFLCERINVYGLAVIGAAFLVMVCAVGWKIKVPPQGWVSDVAGTGDKTAAPTASAVAGKSYTTPEMIHTKVFWVIFFLYMMASVSGIMLSSALSAISQVQLGVTAMSASNLVMISCVANFVSRLSVGRLCDAFGETKTILILMLGTCAALLGMRQSYTYAMFAAFVVVNSYCYGGVLVAFPSLTSKRFGLKHSGLNYGIMFMAYSAAALFAPQVGTWAARPELGPEMYSATFLTAIGFAAAAIFINMILIGMIKREGCILREQALSGG